VCTSRQEDGKKGGKSSGGDGVGDKGQPEGKAYREEKVILVKTSGTDFTLWVEGEDFS